MTVRPTRRPRVRLALGAACLALASATAAVCPETGRPAPSVVTLMASAVRPDTDGWIVSPNCQVETVQVDRTSEDMFYAVSRGIERVESVPTDAASINLRGSPLSQGADLSMAKKATIVSLSAVPPDPLALQFPPATAQIRFWSSTNGELTSLDGIQFPSTLRSVRFSGTSIKSLTNVQFPSTMATLEVIGTPLTSLDLQFPADLKQLILSQLSLSTGRLERLVLPGTLEVFKFTEGRSISIRGIKWPASLRTLDFWQTEITNFEIRASDVMTFTNLNDFRAPVAEMACSGTGDIQTVRSVRVCVISDSEFERLYGTATSPTPANAAGSRSPSKPKASSGGSKPATGTSADGSTDGVSLDEEAASSRSDAGDALGSGASRGKSSSAGSSFDLSTEASSSTVGTDEGSQTASANGTSSPRGQANKPSGAISASNSSGSSGGILAIVVVSTVVVLTLFGVTVYTRKRRAGRSEDVLVGSTGKFEGANTSNTSFDEYASHVPRRQPPPSSEPSEAITGIDFRTDSELVRCRIDHVHIGKQIARGGYGVVYRGTYQGRVVAVKQMLPDAWRDDAMVAAFVDEIRLCARLRHTKIVEFIGVAWTGVRDLCAVTEFMAGGDLHSVIHKYPETSGREWSRPWTTGNLRNKTLIALDVAEALEYLHSLTPTVIHRDLKCKNVLLDLEGNAKLSDFGISRTVSVDETMTSEIGTAAWIAPEVLRGERYSEKADVYSLGVLLAELDRCSHPYASEPVLLMGSMTRTAGNVLSRAHTSHVAHKNTQIAVLVSTGQLKPSPSPGCPDGVAAVVARCVSFEPHERPTPVEVVYQLRQLRG